MTKITGWHLSLRFPNEHDRTIFEIARHEFQNCRTPFAFGYENVANFDAYMNLLGNYRRGINLPTGHVPALFMLGEVDGTVVGRITIRMRLNEPLQRYGGHINYVVRPQFRGQGFAKAMLVAATDIARQLGLKKLLVCSSAHNLPARQVILACGGNFESKVTHDDGEVRDRFWIPLCSEDAETFKPSLPIQPVTLWEGSSLHH